MVNLAPADGAVAMRHKVLRDSHGVFQDRRVSPGIGIVIDAGRRGQNPRHETGPRRIARRGRAVGVRKEHAPAREPIEVGRLDIGMAAQAADPIVQIVNRYKEHVRFALGRLGREC